MQKTSTKPAASTKPPLDTKQSIVNIAQELIQVRGYNAFSYQDLSDRLKIRKASVHHHFPAKEDLGAEVFEASRVRFETWAETLTTNLSAAARLALYIERSGQWAKMRDRICISGICSAEWNTLPKKMKAKASLFQEAHKKVLTKILDDGRKNGEFLKTGTVDDQAFMILSTLQGALMLARARENPELFITVMDQVVKTVLK